MSRKKNPEAGKAPLKVVGYEGDTAGRPLARTALRPSVNAALAITELHSKSLDNLDINELVEELTEQVHQVNRGDLARAEALLIAQAHTLDVMFATLLRRALLQDSLPQYEAHMKFALRAQAQARATVEALGQLKNPPVLIARQANVGGNVQVNNGIPAQYAQARAGAEDESGQGRLLGGDDGERLDRGAARAAGRGDPSMATLGEVHGAAHARGQGGGGA